MDSSAICSPWGFKWRLLELMTRDSPRGPASFNSENLGTGKEKAPGLPGPEVSVSQDAPGASGRHQASQFLDGVRLDLANALGRDTVLAGEIMQSRGRLSGPTAHDDVARTRIQRLHRGLQPV